MRGEKKNVGNRKDIHSFIFLLGYMFACQKEKRKDQSTNIIFFFEVISCPTNRVSIFFSKDNA